MIADTTDRSAAGALLVVDVGNTNTTMCIVRDGQVHDRLDVLTHQTRRLEDGLRKTWDALDAQSQQAICGSVVPEVLAHLKKFTALELDGDLLGIRDDVPFAIKLGVDEPDRVGVDRVCAATAAYMEVNTACAVADFGTALTIDCVDEAGTFLGGTIAPGLDLSATILHDATAALPLVQMQRPAEFGIGTHTEAAIQTGILLGAIGGLREIVEQFATKLGQWPTLIVTGGHADLIAKHCNFVNVVRPDLCLEGIAATYLKHVYDHAQ